MRSDPPSRIFNISTRGTSTAVQRVSAWPDASRWWRSSSTPLSCALSPQSSRRSPLAAVLSPQTCRPCSRRSPLTAVLSPQCFFLPQSCRRSPLAVVLSPQSCRRSALAANLFSPQCSRHSPQCSRRSALVAVLSEPQSCRRAAVLSRLALGSKPRLVDRGRVLVRPERLLHVLAAAPPPPSLPPPLPLSRRICRVSETVRVHGEQHPHHRSLDRSTFARMVTCALHMDHSVACSAACGSPR